jgi:hypothetical protein
MSQVLDAFGLLYFTMLRHVLRLAGVLKLTNGLFLQLSNFFFSGRGEPRITETSDTESMNTGARLYYVFCYAVTK